MVTRCWIQLAGDSYLPGVSDVVDRIQIATSRERSGPERCWAVGGVRTI